MYPSNRACGSHAYGTEDRGEGAIHRMAVGGCVTPSQATPMKRLRELIKALLTPEPRTQAAIERMSTNELRNLIEAIGRTETAARARGELEFRRNFERESAVTINVHYEWGSQHEADWFPYG